jgi:hypothetical protein
MQVQLYLAHGRDTSWQALKQECLQQSTMQHSKLHVQLSVALSTLLLMNVVLPAAPAGSNETLLPPNFKLFESMPAPPDGCVWRINLGTQLWNAVNKTTGGLRSSAHRPARVQDRHVAHCSGRLLR